MPWPVLVIFLIFVGAGALAWYFEHHRKLIRNIRSVPLVPVAEAVEGAVVRITGTLRYLDEPYDAPLSGRRCAASHVDIHEWRKSGKSGSWVPRLTLDDSVDFVVEDATGRAIVRGRAGIEAAIVLDVHLNSGFLKDPTPELERLLTKHGVESVGFLGMNRTMRYREGVLEEGELVTVVGLARWEDDPDADARRRVSGYRNANRHRRLVIETPIESFIRASDDPKALE